MNGAINEWRIVKTTPSVDDIVAGAPITSTLYLENKEISNVQSVSIRVVASEKYFNGFDLNNYKKTVPTEIASVSFSWSVRCSVEYDQSMGSATVE